MTARQDAFVAWALPVAVEASRRTGVRWQLAVAQWALETGYGTSPLYLRHRNLAGIKRSRLPELRRLPVAPGTSFRSYATLTEAVDDWCRVMLLPAYDAVRAASTLDAQAAALGASPWDAGHYTGRPSGTPGAALLPHLTVVERATRPTMTMPADIVGL